jgi:hypothetical protein
MDTPLEAFATAIQHRWIALCVQLHTSLKSLYSVPYTHAGMGIIVAENCLHSQTPSKPKVPTPSKHARHPVAGFHISMQ